MESSDAIMKICSALNLGAEKSTKLLSIYDLDHDRFDSNPQELEQWFKSIMGPYQGGLAFGVFKSLRGLNT